MANPKKYHIWQIKVIDTILNPKYGPRIAARRRGRGKWRVAKNSVPEELTEYLGCTDTDLPQLTAARFKNKKDVQQRAIVNYWQTRKCDQAFITIKEN